MLRHVIKIFLITFIFLLTETLYSQSIFWRRIIGGPYDEEGKNCIQLRDKGYLMAGYKQVRQQGTNFLILQSYLVRLDPYGNVLWEKVIGDSIDYNTALTVIEDPFGNIFLPYRKSYAHLIKMDSQGNILWDKNYAQYRIEIFRGISFVNNFLDLVILSESEVSTIYSTSITKVDSSGNLRWNRIYYDSIPNISGYTSTNNGFYFDNKTYFICGYKGVLGFIIRTDTSGNIIWNRRFLSSGGIFSIAPNSESTFIASGRPYDNFALYCLKFNFNGDSLWSRIYPTEYGFGSEKIVKTLDANFALGTACGFNETRFGIIDSSGNVLRSYRYVYPQNVAVCQWNINCTSDSGFVFAGYHGTFSDSEFPIDALIFKADKNGKTVFVKNLSSQTLDDFDLGVSPNPFNQDFRVTFSLAEESIIEINLYDVVGRLLQTVERTIFNSGRNQIFVSTPEFNSGVYFLRVKINNKLFTKKIVLIK